MPSTFSGIVLAGGAGRRMGRDKAALDIGGVPLLRHVVARLRTVAHDVTVVGPQTLESLNVPARIVPDEIPGYGPVAGLMTGLRAVESEWAVAVACDMPLLSPALLDRMCKRARIAREADVIVVETARGFEPLHAVYRRTALPIAEDYIDAGHHSMRGLLAALRCEVVPRELVATLDPHGRSWFNANTPDDWRLVVELLAREDQVLG